MMDIKEIVRTHKEKTDKILSKYLKGKNIRHRVIRKMTLKEIEELELTLKELNEERKQIKEQIKDMELKDVELFVELMGYTLLIKDLRVALLERKRKLRLRDLKSKNMGI